MDYDSIADLPLEERHVILRRWLSDLTTVYEKCAAERTAQMENAPYLAGKLAEVDRERLALMDEVKALRSAFQEKEELRRERDAYQTGYRRLYEDYGRLHDAAEELANAVVAYFNKRGAAHAERKGNEDIAAMANALSDYGYAVNQAHTGEEGQP